MFKWLFQNNLQISISGKVGHQKFFPELAGGLRHGATVISGESVYQTLKYEGGIHRVQRVPKTERAGRIHTSTASVAVFPQPSEVHCPLYCMQNLWRTLFFSLVYDKVF